MTAAAGGTRRPAVDLIVPFAGSDRQFDELVDRLGSVGLGEGDSIFLVDNRRGAPPSADRGRVQVIAAFEQQSSYFARNRGAEAGRAEWMLFLDADVEMPADIIDLYFRTPPADGTAILVGSLLNRARAGERVSVAGRYAELVRMVDQEHTLGKSLPYAQTANCAIRRRAFEEIGGFRESIRSGGDADLCFRLAGAGWELERRFEAEAIHVGRSGLIGMLGQKARHASGLRWLDDRYPGVGVRRSALGVGRTVLSGVAIGSANLMRGRRDPAILHLVGALDAIAQWVGYRIPNRPWREMLARRRPDGAPI